MSDETGLQSRILNAIIAVEWLLVAAAGVNVLWKGYQVVEGGANLQLLNESLAVFIIGLCLVMMMHVLIQQQRLIGA